MLTNRVHMFSKKVIFKLVLFFVIVTFGFFMIGCDKTVESTDTTVSVDWDKNTLKAPLHTVYLYYGYSTWEPLNYIRLVTEDSVYLGDVTVKGHVDVTIIGEYTVTYSVVLFGRELSDTVTFVVLDNVAPTISFSSDHKDYIIDQGSTIDLMSVIESVDDDYDDLSISDVEIVSEIDPSTIGEYIIIYRLTDLSGNFRDYVKKFVVMGFTKESILSHLDDIEIIRYIHLDNNDDLFVIRYQNLDRILVFHEDTIVFSRFETIGVYYKLDYVDSTHVLISSQSKSSKGLNATISVYNTETHEDNYLFNGSIHQVTSKESNYSNREVLYYAFKDNYDLYQINEDFSLSLLYDNAEDVVSWDVQIPETVGEENLDVIVFEYYRSDESMISVLLNTAEAEVIRSFDSSEEQVPTILRWNDIVLFSTERDFDILNPYSLTIYGIDGNLKYEHLYNQFLITTQETSSVMQMYYQSESRRFIYTYDSEMNTLATFTTTDSVSEVRFEDDGHVYLMLDESNTVEVIDANGTVSSSSLTSAQTLTSINQNELFGFYDQQYYIYDQGELTTISSSVSYQYIQKVDTSRGAVYILYSDVDINSVNLCLYLKGTGERLEQSLGTFDEFSFVSSDLSDLLFISANEVQTNLYYINAETFAIQDARLSYALSSSESPRILRHLNDIVVLSNIGIYLAPYDDFYNESVNQLFDSWASNVYLFFGLSDAKDVLFVQYKDPYTTYLRTIAYYGNIEDGLDHMGDHDLGYRIVDEMIIVGPDESMSGVFIMDESNQEVMKLSMYESFSFDKVAMDEDTLVMYLTPEYPIQYLNITIFSISHFDGLYE